MSTSFSFTALKSRDKRIYSLEGIKLSDTGISYAWLKVFGVFFLITNIIGVLICIVSGQILYNPITENGEINPVFDIIMIGVPALIASISQKRIKSYRIYEYVLSYIMPKKHYDQNMNQIKHANYKFDQYIENPMA